MAPVPVCGAVGEAESDSLSSGLGTGDGSLAPALTETCSVQQQTHVRQHEESWGLGESVPRK